MIIGLLIALHQRADIIPAASCSYARYQETLTAGVFSRPLFSLNQEVPDGGPKFLPG